MQLPANMAARRELFRAHGVDVNDPALHESLHDRDQRIQRENRAMTVQMEQLKAQVYASYSLWPNGQPMSFSFNQWKPEMQKNAKQARNIGIQVFRLSKELLAKPFNVILCGFPGVGKTSLGLALMKTAAQQGLSTMFVSTTLLAKMYSDSYSDWQLKDRLNNTIRAMKEVDTLMLDDFGTEGGIAERVMSDQYRGVRQDMMSGMYELANARWDDQHNQPKGHTIITTNNFSDELVKIYDPKTISRLISNDKRYRVLFNGMQDMRGVGA